MECRWKRFAPSLLLLLLAGCPSEGPQAPAAAPERGASFARPGDEGAAPWLKLWGGKGNDQGHGIAVDASGNVVITGSFRDEASFGGAALNTDYRGEAMFLAKLGPDGSHLWSQGHGGALTRGTAVAVDASGHIAVVGIYRSGRGAEPKSLDLGGGPLLVGPNVQLFVARFAPDGRHLWSRGFGGDSDDTALGVACDARGDIIVIGRFYTRVSFGGDALETGDGQHLLVAKYSAADGAHQWSRSFGGRGKGRIPHAAVALGKGEEIHVGGSFVGMMAFGKQQVESQGNVEDIFVAQLAADGTPRWARSFGSAGGDSARDIALGPDGQIILVGGFQQSVDFGGGPLRSHYANDAYVLALGADGKHLWSRRFGEMAPKDGKPLLLLLATPGYATAVAADAKGVVTVTGVFREMAFGDSEHKAEGRTDGFLLRLGSDGKLLGSELISGRGSDRPLELALSAKGSAFIIGESDKGLRFKEAKAEAGARTDVFVLAAGR